MTEYGDLVPLEMVQDSADEHEPVRHLVHHPRRVPARQAVAGLVQADQIVALESSGNNKRQIINQDLLRRGEERCGREFLRCQATHEVPV